MTDQFFPYASPREEATDAEVISYLPSVTELPIHYSGIVKPEEVIAASRLALRGSWVAHRHVIVRGVLFLLNVGMIIVLSFEALFNDFPINVFSLSLLAIYIGALAFRPVFFKMKLKDMQRRNLGCYQYTEGIIREDGFETKSADGAAQIKWNTFRGLRVGENVAVLYYEKHRGYCFFTRSKFKNEADWQRLISFLKSRFPYGSL